RADRGRSVRLDPGTAVTGLLHRHPGQRPRRRRGDLDLPRAAARDHRIPHAARRAPRRGDVTAVARRRGRNRGRLVRAGRWFVIAFFTLFLAFPFYWMLITIFKQNADLYATENNPFLFNASPTLGNLHLLVYETGFVRWLGNTALVGVLVVAITL